MTELQRLARCLADDYQFECQGGPLRNCTEWRALCAAINTLAVHPPSGASSQADTGANVRALTVHICEDCLNLRGEMCNEPCCRFCRRTMAEVAEYLDVLLIRPRIDGVSVLVDEGTPLPPVSPVEPTGASPQAETPIQTLCNNCMRSERFIAPDGSTLCHYCGFVQPAPVIPASPQAETSDGDAFFSRLRARWAAETEALKSAPVSPVEPEPPTLEPCAHELDYHNCAECVGPKVEPEPPICSDPHLLKRGCECASCLDPVRLKRQLLEVWEKYRAFVDAVASALHVESERGPVSEVSVIEAARDTLNQLLDSPTVEPEPPTTCRCLDCEPLADPGPKPSEDDINRLEKAAWDSKTDRVLVWYRDRAEMFRQRLRETERAWQLDRKKPTVEPEPCVWREKYNELLFAVERAYPGESRHETALRYIREKETVESCAPKAPLKVEREP